MEWLWVWMGVKRVGELPTPLLPTAVYTVAHRAWVGGPAGAHTLLEYNTRAWGGGAVLMSCAAVVV